MAERLSGYRILILEAREEAQFSRLLAEQGANVMPCPMFSIVDAPDAAPVEAWIGRFIREPCDDLVLTTGEGLRRLRTAARRIGAEAGLITAIAKCRTVARGPKPGRALREIGLQPHIVTEQPTTEGIIATLALLDLTGHRVGLQLYPDKDHAALLDTVTSRGASADPITPYIYDARAADASILAAIDAMAQGRVDAIALTASAQVRRLIDVARAHDCEDKLRDALAQTPIASVGPVVSEALQSFGLSAAITPMHDAFFIKPLISAMAATLQQRAPRNGAPTP